MPPGLAVCSGVAFSNPVLMVSWGLQGVGERAKVSPREYLGFRDLSHPAGAGPLREWGGVVGRGRSREIEDGGLTDSVGGLDGHCIAG